MCPSDGNHPQRFAEAAALRQLDVDPIHLADEWRDVGDGLAAFIRDHRYVRLSRDDRQAVQVVRRKRLLEHGKPELIQHGQHPDGAFPGHFGEPGSRPVIFNQGQIMHGMLAGCLQLGRGECLESAVRAGHWLARQQDADGCWRKFEHNDVPHTYNTRGTWALRVP